jgi:nucleotide-binding universal stress UspA family protein
MKIKNVLVAVDFSPHSRLAVNYGITLARQFRATLTLMHVVEGPAFTYGFSTESDRIGKQH